MECVWDNDINECRGIRPSDLLQEYQYWYEPFTMCKDTLNLCRDKSDNLTHFEFSIDWEKEEPTNQNEVQHLPANYFCHFQVTLDPKVDWYIKVVRYF